VGEGGDALGFEPVDLSSLSAGWHAFASGAPAVAKRVELRFEGIGGGGEIPGLELWSDAAPQRAARADLGASDLPEGYLAYESPTKQAEAAPGTCVSFPVALPRPPSQPRRTHLVYEARGLLRAFEIRRSLNGRMPYGGSWIGTDGEARTFVEEIDPAALSHGANDVRFCLPANASLPVTISKLRIVGELDRGAGLATDAVIGPDRRDGRALFDGDPATSASIGAGERVVIGFERLIAPDAVVLSGTGDLEPRIECLDQGGGMTPIAAARVNAVLQLEGGASACASLGLTFSTPTTLGELDVIGSGAAERVDWPRIVVTSPAEHFGMVAWVGGFIARPPVLTGAIRVEVAARQADAMTGDFGRLVERTSEPSTAWTVPVSARFPDGGRQLAQVVLELRQRSIELLLRAPRSRRHEVRLRER
jgi:hypothetical protein